MVYRIPHRWLRWPAGATEHQLAYGADYNPEQWPSQTWAQDQGS
jgi:beta-galactosidase